MKCYQPTEKERYSYKYDSSFTEKPSMYYRNVAIFPFNKGMHSFIRVSSPLPFKIVDVYDVKYSPNIGTSTDLLLNIKTNNVYEIKKRDDIGWDPIDTLIIGHTHTLLNGVMKDCKLIENLLNKAQNENKNVLFLITYNSIERK